MTKNSKPGVTRAVKMLIALREITPRIRYAQQRLEEVGLNNLSNQVLGVVLSLEAQEQYIMGILGSDRLEKLQAPAKRGRNIKITRKRLTKNPR